MVKVAAQIVVSGAETGCRVKGADPGPTIDTTVSPTI